MCNVSNIPSLFVYLTRQQQKNALNRVSQDISKHKRKNVEPLLFIEKRRSNKQQEILFTSCKLYAISKTKSAQKVLFRRKGIAKQSQLDRQSPHVMNSLSSLIQIGCWYLHFYFFRNIINTS